MTKSKINCSAIFSFLTVFFLPSCVLEDDGNWTGERLDSGYPLIPSEYTIYIDVKTATCSDGPIRSHSDERYYIAITQDENEFKIDATEGIEGVFLFPSEDSTEIGSLRKNGDFTYIKKGIVYAGWFPPDTYSEVTITGSFSGDTIEGKYERKDSYYSWDGTEEIDFESSSSCLYNGDITGERLL